jgi:hypothetical protein
LVAQNFVRSLIACCLQTKVDSSDEKFAVGTELVVQSKCCSAEAVGTGAEVWVDAGGCIPTSTRLDAQQKVDAGVYLLAVEAAVVVAAAAASVHAVFRLRAVVVFCPIPSSLFPVPETVLSHAEPLSPWFL